MPSGNRILTTTQDKIIATAVDTVLRSNVFANLMLTKAKKWSGELMKFPIMYQKSTAGVFFKGFESLPTNASETMVNMQYEPTFYTKHVTLPRTELSINDVKETQVINLKQIHTSWAAQQMADEIGTSFYGDGSAPNSFNGLENIVDDGTNAATIGGLPRATYTTLNSTVISAPTITLLKMENLWAGITDGMQEPTLGLCDYTVFGLYSQLLNPQERITKTGDLMKKGLVGGTGFTSLYFKGFPVTPDRKCTAQTMYFINEDYLDFYALPFEGSTPVKYKATDIEGNDYSDVPGNGFGWCDWVQPVGQLAYVGRIVLGGNLTTNNPRRHGKLTSIAGV